MSADINEIIRPFMIGFFVLLFMVGLIAIIGIKCAQYLQDKVKPSAKIIPERSVSAQRHTAAEPPLSVDDFLPASEADAETDVSMTSGDDEETKASPRPMTAFRRGQKSSKTGLTLVSDGKLEFDKDAKSFKNLLSLGECIKTQLTPECTVHQGCFGDDLVLVKIVKPQTQREHNFLMTLKDRGQHGLITSHPRFVRFIGCCPLEDGQRIYVLSDFALGVNLKELDCSTQLRQIFRLTEREKLQVAADLAEAVFFLHNLWQPHVHGHICPENILIDAETHRGKLCAPEINWKTKLLEAESRKESLFAQASPELVLCQKLSTASDVWSLSACILQLLLDRHTWNNLDFLQQALEMQLPPDIIDNLASEPKLAFFKDAFHYQAELRPHCSFIFKKCTNLLTEAAQFPAAAAPVEIQLAADPLMKQQVDWNVRQESGKKMRTLMVANVKYDGRKFRRSLSVTPINDIKDVSSLLQHQMPSSYSLENSFENIQSARHFHSILSCYSEAVEKSKSSQEVELLLFYFSGIVVKSQSISEEFYHKKDLGLVLERASLTYDLGLVMQDESIYPLIALQSTLAMLPFKRKLIILDGRMVTLDKIPKQDLKFLAIPEQCLDFLATLLTIYPDIEDGSIDKVIEMDSHPERTNGFLTGCLLNILRDSMSIENLSRKINNEMLKKSKNMRAFQGIVCKSDYVKNDSDLWNFALI